MTRASFKEILPSRLAQRFDLPMDARLPKCIGMPADAAAVLGGLRVGLIGTSSVGGAVAQHLCRMGVGSLYLVDRAPAFKPSNLLTHVWLPPEAVGKPKASYVAQFCRKINPEAGVFAFDGEAQSLPSTAFADLDYLFLATDNLKAETDVDEQCLRWGVPLIQAAVHGETLTAQVRFFSHADADAPCLRCGYSAAEQAALDNELVFACQGALDGQSRGRAVAAPTMSTSFLCGMAAELGVMQLFRHVLGLGRPVADTLVEYCGYTHRTVVSPLARNPNCPCDHQPWRQLATPRPSLADCTLAELVTAAGHRHGQTTTVTVDDDYHFIERAVCRGGHRVAVGRYGLPGQSMGHCAICGASLQADAAVTHRTIALACFGSVFHQPLRTIHADPSWVMVRCNDIPNVFRTA